MRHEANGTADVPPRLIVWMSFRLVIPWRVALPQSPPPLHQPGPSCNTGFSPYNDFSANGDS